VKDCFLPVKLLLHLSDDVVFFPSLTHFFRCSSRK